MSVKIIDCHQFMDADMNDGLVFVFADTDQVARVTRLYVAMQLMYSNVTSKSGHYTPAFVDYLDRTFSHSKGVLKIGVDGRDLIKLYGLDEYSEYYQPDGIFPRLAFRFEKIPFKMVSTSIIKYWSEIKLIGRKYRELNVFQDFCGQLKHLYFVAPYADSISFSDQPFHQFKDVYDNWEPLKEKFFMRQMANARPYIAKDQLDKWEEFCYKESGAIAIERLTGTEFGAKYLDKILSM